ncbi:hypothetical protein EIN_369770 [Entamoeba invadens IP1]|uniref:Furin repeat-containing protein n=1 Tax=Entamoeba invadens IP1 TaxID=370355 RepID=A0A0A1UBR7_ENTIV|nr:hypothetical protein EIN_369770 [Entamoeba invadens IP1]ELP92655.1 hypothetical protein EIN_369770 [Entamoeba invadens IP1]|eukprot:XP_004259426.1 hypothetical protein EIN_369770 [Entamoeba invadens IP1]
MLKMVILPLLFISYVNAQCNAAAGQVAFADDGKCRDCDGIFPGCSKCTEAACSECKAGFKFDNGVCTYLNGFKDDTTCLDNYVKVGSTCQYCLHCSGKCEAEKLCTGCDEGYYLVNGHCLACSRCKAGKCTVSGGCSECEDNYFVKAKQCNTCGQCATGKCSSTGCTQCVSDKYTLKDGVCTLPLKSLFPSFDKLH